MSGDGADNAHNNAFGGGKNPGMGNSGSGNTSGASGNGGNSNGWSWSDKPHPNDGFHNDGSFHITFHGESTPENKPGGHGGSSVGGKGSKGKGVTITPVPGKPGSYASSDPEKTMLAKSIDDNSANGTGSYTLHTEFGATIRVTVPGGDINNMKAEYSNWKGPKLNHKNLRNFIKGFMDFRAAEKARDEKEALLKASELISDMGEKLGEHLSEKYKAVAKEIANDIKNFQGKTLRTHKQAMASLNKIMANPGMKINKGDRDALINAWKSFKASDTAKKLANMSRAFKVADVALKAEKVREKSIEGYETGNWGPLMLEVESWVLSGVATGVAMGLFGAILSMLPVTGLALTAITIARIMAISYLSSKIDDKIAEKINNEVIRPAH
ncbi:MULTISPECIES: colicin-like pore-forming protein [unclassified Serratia (in: enterobacteria)]|uniref:colicin-like pore-forming protein n=1 Tax=unclassified Serratia (in: enterobacteria) TaxID=2647522 RepID=UPI0027E6BA2C|nr:MULTISPECIES: colicin-like pore-forming protein [unclassified Serratia (in: enterobacteria)]MDQ7098150.1 colicin-like pore-forming protein [Serratia sp. MF2]MDQ7101972.1 colicin-like pore-forming protein [Serratia sp. MF1(2023)]